MSSCFRIGDWDCYRLIGSGSFGEVYRAKNIAHQDQPDVAIKKISLAALSNDPTSLSRVASEIDLLRRASSESPHIVQLTAILRSSSDICLVTELCWGDTSRLQRLQPAGRFTRAHARRFAMHLAHGLAALHHQGIIHRDLKPENLLVTTSSPDSALLKVADFGFARLTGPSSALLSCVGTPYFMAPEVLSQVYDARADLWSFGALLFAWLTGQAPERQPFTTVEAYIKQQRDALATPIQLPPLILDCGDAQLIDLLQRTLEKDATKRINLSEFYSHPWLFPENQSLSTFVNSSSPSSSSASSTSSTTTTNPSSPVNPSMPSIPFPTTASISPEFQAAESMIQSYLQLFSPPNQHQNPTSSENNDVSTHPRVDENEPAKSLTLIAADSIITDCSNDRSAEIIRARVLEISREIQHIFHPQAEFVPAIDVWTSIDRLVDECHLIKAKYQSLKASTSSAPITPLQATFDLVKVGTTLTFRQHPSHLRVYLAEGNHICPYVLDPQYIPLLSPPSISGDIICLTPRLSPSGYPFPEHSHIVEVIICSSNINYE